MRIACVLGTRPEIIKFASIIKEIKKGRDKLLLIHTGQHYDYEMSDTFIRTLNLPKPDYNLDVGSASRSIQIAKTMERLEKVLVRESPDIVLAQGDTNVVPAALLTARHLLIPSGHVEAGLRSFNPRSPEEINRKVATTLASIHFAPTRLNKVILMIEGVDERDIYITGGTVVDAIKMVKHEVEHNKVIEKLGLKFKKPMILCTAHRSYNVDDRGRLANIFGALAELNEFTIVFPIHPRTKKNAEKFGLMKRLEKTKHVVLTPPLDYVDFLALMKASDLILTDSGGVQEEACEFKKPVVTMRRTTPRWETVFLGINSLVGTDKKKIVAEVRRVSYDIKLKRRIKRIPNPYGNGKSGKQIVRIIKRLYDSKKLKYEEPELGVPKKVEDIWVKTWGK